MSESQKEALTGFQLRVSEDDGDVAYLRLPSYLGVEACKMSRSVRLREVLGNYEGPDVVFDFDMRGVLVGIEVLA